MTRIAKEEKHTESLWINTLENVHFEYRGDDNIKMLVRGMGREKWMMKLAYNRPDLKWLPSMLAVLNLRILLLQ
jgi:hypothetical protein